MRLLSEMYIHHTHDKLLREVIIIIIIIITIIIINLIHIEQFDTIGILTALYIVTK